jgi:hypothetical protein
MIGGQDLNHLFKSATHASAKGGRPLKKKGTTYGTNLHN